MAEEPISAEIILYQAGGTNVPVEVRYQDETMWMPQAQIAELFGTTKQNVSYHLSNIFHEGELSKDSVVKELPQTANRTACSSTTSTQSLRSATA